MREKVLQGESYYGIQNPEYQSVAQVDAYAVPGLGNNTCTNNLNLF